MDANNIVLIKTHTTQATHARDDTKLCIDVAFLTAIVENGGRHQPSNDRKLNYTLFLVY